MKLEVKSDEHIIVVSYEDRDSRSFIKTGEIRFNDTNFIQKKDDFCVENNVYNSQVNIMEYYENEKQYKKHQQEVIDWQTKVECGND